MVNYHCTNQASFDSGEIMIDLDTEFGKQVVDRLQTEEVIWLTTVTPKGVPHPNPVWFCWDGKCIIIYSQPGSFRIRNIEHNPKVALNFQGVDVMGNHAVVVLGEAKLNYSYSAPHPGFEQKYMKYLPQMSITFEQLVANYSVEITIEPSRVHS
jgi:PPOX class probable F420-dependent enzyme